MSQAATPRALLPGPAKLKLRAKALVWRHQVCGCTIRYYGGPIERDSAIFLTTVLPIVNTSLACN